MIYILYPIPTDLNEPHIYDGGEWPEKVSKFFDDIITVF